MDWIPLQVGYQVGYFLLLLLYHHTNLLTSLLTYQYAAYAPSLAGVMVSWFVVRSEANCTQVPINSKARKSSSEIHNYLRIILTPLALV